MFIQEFENIKISIGIKAKTKWEKKLGKKIEDIDKIECHWIFLKGSTFRTNFVKVKCDDCNVIFERRIRDLDPVYNYHLCKHCSCKGERNIHYGKPNTEKQKEATRRWMIERGNPFTWKEIIEKIKDKNPWIKCAEKNRGQKRSEECKKRMSESAVLAFKEGRRVPTNGWSIKQIKEYNGIKYQGKYELNFLKYLESINKINEIEKGPVISYFDLCGKEHNYFIDFRIKNSNIVFEIKSTYYWKKALEINESKMKEASRIYNYNLILDNNFENIEKLFNENI